MPNAPGYKRRVNGLNILTLLISKSSGSCFSAERINDFRSEIIIIFSFRFLPESAAAGQ
jgi:hypothetical protein